MGQLKSKTGPSRDDVDFLLSNTSFSEQAIIGWHKVFRRNTGNTGFLSQTQFLALHTKFFPNSEAREYVSHVFRAYGKTRNGAAGKNDDYQLGFREYVLAIHETKSGSEEARLKRAFLMFDVEKRGVVEEKDVAEVYRSTGGMLKQGMIKQGVNQMLNQGVVNPEEEARLLFFKLDPLGQGEGVDEAQFIQALLQKGESGNQSRASVRMKRTSSRLKRAKSDRSIHKSNS